MPIIIRYTFFIYFFCVLFMILVTMSCQKSQRIQAHRLIIQHIIHQLIIRAIPTVHIHSQTNGVEITIMIIINGAEAIIIHQAMETINMEAMEIHIK